MTIRFKRSLAVMPAVALLVGTAHAQFAGDVYFADPSQSAVVGEEVTFEVVTFAGNIPVGAAAIELTYDPSFVEVVRVDAGADQPLNEEIVTSKEEGRLTFVVLNEESLTRPIGTVSLADVTFRAKEARPSSQRIDLAIREMLSTNTVSFPNADGFGGRLFVSGGGNQLASANTFSALAAGSTSKSSTSSDLMAQALEMRRAGSTVEIDTASGPVTVVTRAAGPSEDASDKARADEPTELSQPITVDEEDDAPAWRDRLNQLLRR